MAVTTKAAIAAKIASLFLDNNTQEISEADLREVSTDILDTMVALFNDANNIQFGDGADSANKVIIIDNGDANLPAIRYNVSTSKFQFSNDGVTFQDLGTGGGVSGLAANQLLFGEENTNGGIEQNAAISWINSTTSLVLGTVNPTTLDASGVLRILHNITDYIRILGNNTGEQGRLAIASNGSGNPAELAAFNNGGGADAYMKFSNALGGTARLLLEIATAEIFMRGRGDENVNLLELYNHLNNLIFEFKNKGEILGSYTGLLPTVSETDKASLYVDNSKVNGLSQDGNASWFLRTEDGKVIDLRQAGIQVLRREFAYPLEPSKTFELIGNASVFNIIGVAFDTVKISSIDYEVRRPAVGLPAGLDYQGATNLSDVIAWHGGSNTIGGNAYASPSATDHIDILPTVTWATGWTGTATVSLIIQVL